jgi:multidrug efflux pump
LSSSTTATNANAALGSNAAKGSAVSTTATSQVPLSTVATWANGIDRGQRQPYRWRTFGHDLVQPAPGLSLGQAAQTIATTQASLPCPPASMAISAARPRCSSNRPDRCRC